MSNMLYIAGDAALHLRHFRADDLAAFQAYRQNPEIGLYQGWEVMDDTRASHFLAAMSDIALFPKGDWVQLAIATGSDSTLIGDYGICLDKGGQEAEIGVTLAPGAQGKGLATRSFALVAALVFTRTDARRLTAITDARNTASRALIARLGMRETSVDEAIFQGEPCIEHSFELTRADWLA